MPVCNCCFIWPISVDDQAVLFFLSFDCMALEARVLDASTKFNCFLSLLFQEQIVTFALRLDFLLLELSLKLISIIILFFYVSFCYRSFMLSDNSWNIKCPLPDLPFSFLSSAFSKQVQTIPKFGLCFHSNSIILKKMNSL